MCGDEETKLGFSRSGWKKQKTEVVIFFMPAASFFFSMRLLDTIQLRKLLDEDKNKTDIQTE